MITDRCKKCFKISIILVVLVFITAFIISQYHHHYSYDTISHLKPQSLNQSQSHFSWPKYDSTEGLATTGKLFKVIHYIMCLSLIYNTIVNMSNECYIG